jgi:hypothetical protein
MATEQEVMYHRSFLSYWYLENLNPPTRGSPRYLERQAREIDTMRRRDPELFERTRKSLAMLLKVPYLPGDVQNHRGDPGGRFHWVSGQPSDAEVVECMAPDYPWQGAVRSPSGSIAWPLLGITHKAYVHGKTYHLVNMFQKVDQRFEDNATPWELAWSSLTFSYSRCFIPIVDSGWTVVGHSGTVPGGGMGPIHLKVPGGLGGSMTLEEALANGVPVLVHDDAPLPGWENGNFYTTEHTIEVRTGVDGEVVDFLVSSAGHTVRPWYAPAELVVGTKIVTTPGTTGDNQISSLVRETTTAREIRGYQAAPYRPVIVSPGQPR